MAARKKKTTNESIVGLIVIALLLGCIAYFVGNARPPTFLLVQEALVGTFIPVEGQADTYALRLVGVKPHTLLFTDRPNRTVGSWTNADFITRWQQGSDSFAKDPPNAVLLSHDPVDGKEYSIVVELKDPAFNAIAGTMTYTATVLKYVSEHDLAPSAERHTGDFPGFLRQPALFIDNAGGWFPNAYAPATGEEPMGES